MGCIASATRGDRYSFPIFLTTLSGLTMVGAVSAVIAVQTRDKTYDEIYQTALSDIERQVKAQPNQELVRPSLVGRDGQTFPAA